ncbi:uncharacterized protein UDID_19169 [Ustilago sp. UG-2017a]|nr:uncharacterized protein UDID_19169 [Ustilago sp. UG-2017a]
MVEQEARGLAGTGSRHGWRATSMENAISMETMDMEDRPVCKEVQALPQGGPSSRSMQMVTTQGLERQEPKEPSPVKGKEQCMGDRQAGPEEEEQCRRSRYSSGGQGCQASRVARRRSSVEGVDTAQEDRSGARGPPCTVLDEEGTL